MLVLLARREMENAEIRLFALRLLICTKQDDRRTRVRCAHSNTPIIVYRQTRTRTQKKEIIQF